MNGDGYFETFEFYVGIDGDVSSGSGDVNVYGKVICPTTGQAWWLNNPWTIRGIVTDPQYLPLNETDFAGHLSGSMDLDFTVELWDASKTECLDTETGVHFEPVQVEGYTDQNYLVHGMISNFTGGVDTNGDGYYETFHFLLGIDGDVGPGWSPVCGKIICNTTGQSWWLSAPWIISGIAMDYHYLPLDETDFEGCLSGKTDLDFTVELWDQFMATKLAVTTHVFGEPVQVTVGLPSLTIAMSAQILSYDTTVFALSGTANLNVVGTMWASNALNGVVETFAAFTEWTSPAVDIEVGENMLTVYGSNAVGVVGQESFSIIREPETCGTVYYVSPMGDAVYPYTHWATAARVIQDAVEAAMAGDTILVAPGTYSTGGGVTPGYGLSNRVVIAKPIVVQSIAGPERTVILGAPDPVTDSNGVNAVRGVYLTEGAALRGFTISNGYTRTLGEGGEALVNLSGGGVFLDYDSIVSNCTISGNSAHEGGGVCCNSGGEVNDSTISGNSARYGGGVRCNSGGEVNNGTISGNAAFYGGGVYCDGGGKINNSTISNNLADGDQAYGGGVYCNGGGEINHDTISGNSADYGGGVCCDQGGEINNSTISENLASDDGGGIFCYDGGMINSCTISENLASDDGGGIFCYQRGVIHNSTISGNSARYGGGVCGDLGGQIHNCIIYFNTSSSSGDNYDNQSSGMSYNHCCTTPELDVSLGLGNIPDNPLFVDLAGGDFHLQPGSPCINAGNNQYAFGNDDLDGTSRIMDERVDMGCYEAPRTIPISLTHYVSLEGNHTFPYTSWETAAHTIQDAVYVAERDDTVLVADGTYNTGGGVTPGYSLSNRVVVTKAITIQSVSGPEQTIILGAPDPITGSNGVDAVRGGYLVDGASLIGFMVSNGYTCTSGSGGDSYYYDRSGGGLLLNFGGVVSNCVVSGNSAAFYAGGVYCSEGGEINHCTISDNSAVWWGGGVYCRNDSVLNNCIISGNSGGSGGGVCCDQSGAINDCTISENSADSSGGGVYCASGSSTIHTCMINGNSAHLGGGVYDGHASTIHDSTISNNVASSRGGGVYGHASTIHDSTISDNVASHGGGVYGKSSTISNSTIHGNSAHTSYGDGGGVFCDSGTVNNSTINGNSAGHSGGGVRCYGDAGINHNEISDNSARFGGGVHCSGGDEIDNCTISGNSASDSGGGVYCYEGGRVSNCSISENSSSDVAGGVYCKGGEVNNSTIRGNLANQSGGGVLCHWGGAINNCTISGNSAEGINAKGGGVFCDSDSEINNCIIYFNRATSNNNDNYYNIGHNQVYNQCCATPALDTYLGSGNISEDPLFVDYSLSDYHLQAGSPCIDSGNNAYVIGEVDLDGNMRIQNGFVDIGAYEYDHAFWIFIDTPIQTVPYETSTLSISGTAGEHVVGTMWISNTANGAEEMFPTSVHWTSPTIDLEVGENVLTVYGTNWQGVVAQDRVSIVREHGAPSVTIFTPTQTVSSDTTLFTLSGTANDSVIGTMWISNAVNGVEEMFSASTNWTSTGIDIEIGENLLYVYGTNGLGAIAEDHVVITRSRFLDDANTTAMHYVSPGGGDIWPYTNWTTAARVIQHAVDTAMEGDTVLVADGTYDTGGGVTPGYNLSNRLVITNEITVQSVNGSEFTVIQGAGPMGYGAVRCVYLSAGVLSGFTVTNGHTLEGEYLDSGSGGGGVYVEGGGTVTHCTMIGNHASYGGGAYGGTVSNSVIRGNSAYAGGGTHSSLVNSCTIHGNSAYGYSVFNEGIAIGGFGGGIYGGVANNSIISDNDALVIDTHFGPYGGNGGGVWGADVNNCTIIHNHAEAWGGGAGSDSFEIEIKNSIVWSNSAGWGDHNYYDCRLLYSCTAPLPVGTSNIEINPQFVNEAAENYHLQSNSPCMDVGNNAYVVGAFDLDGNPRIQNGTVDIGAYEYDESSMPTVSISTPAQTVPHDITTFSLSGTANEHVVETMWISNAVNGSVETFAASTNWVSPTITLEIGRNGLCVFGSNRIGMVTQHSVVIIRSRFLDDDSSTLTHYVSPSGGNIWPYTNWMTAAWVIQHAVDTAVEGDRVLVGDGIYNTGGGVMYSLSNRVVITNAITVQSFNGPDHTTILGAPDSGTGSHGPNAVRGVYLSETSALAGFTISNGYTRTSGTDDQCGGGVFLYDNGTVSNCIIIGNSAYGAGGGLRCISGGRIIETTISNNSVYYGFGGGVKCSGTTIITNSTIRRNNATWGGGVSGGNVYGSVISENSANSHGGGTSGSMINNCTISSNVANGNGGGTYGGTMSSCVIRGNHAADGGGTHGGTISNCIINGNTAIDGGGTFGGVLENCEIESNSSTCSGGGAYEGTLHDCRIASNNAGCGGGGASGSTLYNCIVLYNSASWSGGGTSWSTINDCTISENSADGSGGGTSGGVIHSSVISYNSAGEQGGGVAGGMISNCTISGNLAEGAGGGTSGGTIHNSVVSENRGVYSGGGAYQSTLNNCLIIGNSVYAYLYYDEDIHFSSLYGGHGGGTYGGTVNNCTIANNTAYDRAYDGGGFYNEEGSYGGGTYEGTIKNSIVYDNDAPEYSNHYNSTLEYSCTIPHPGGLGNISDPPLFAGNYRAQSSSPCIDAGHNAYVVGEFDLDGNPRIHNETVDIGAYEYGSVSPPSVTITTPSQTVPYDTTSVSLSGTANERAVGAMWISNAVNGMLEVFATSTDWISPAVEIEVGENELTVYGTNAVGVIAQDSAVITRETGTDGTVHYVSLSGAHLYPFTNWVSAATNIQAAVDAAQSNDTVRVTNGVYATGGAITPGYSLNTRVVVAKSVTVESVNGPRETIILGRGDWPEGVLLPDNGPGTVRCAYLTKGASLIGFTLSNGYTKVSGHWYYDRSAGGVLLDQGGTLSNCVIVGNSADVHAGGVFCAFSGSLQDCVLSANWAGHSGGGVAFYGDDDPERSVITGCLVAGNSASDGGGGIYLSGSSAFIDHCMVSNNAAALGGGIRCDYGASPSISQSTIAHNTADYYGGIGCWGDATPHLKHCRILDNYAVFDGAGIGLSGGSAVIEECLIQGNIADRNAAGIQCTDGSSATLLRCMIRENTAQGVGGGLHYYRSASGRIEGCLIAENQANIGGGLVCQDYAMPEIVNCTIVSNQAILYGGGMSLHGYPSDPLFFNTILWGNTPDQAGAGAHLFYFCDVDQNGFDHTNANLRADPLFVDPDTKNYRLQAGSPCIDTGDNAEVSENEDLNGTPRIINHTVDIGAYEFGGTDMPSFEITTPAQTVSNRTETIGLTGTINEHVAGSMWASNEMSGVVYPFAATNPWSILADLVFGENRLTVYATNYVGTLAQKSVFIIRPRLLEDEGGTPTHYVSTTGSALWPYTTWETAATTIQDAVDTAMDGDLVLVDNGIYATGGRRTPAYKTLNRVVVERAVTVRSVNGPETTLILGAPDPDTGGHGHLGVRGVYLTDDAALIGFTVSNGHTRINGHWMYDQCAGGVLLDQGGSISNCIIRGNATFLNGGGFYGYQGGELDDCTISDNSAHDAGGGFCHQGGVVNQCIISNNVAEYDSGGLYCWQGGEINTCLIIGNVAEDEGGGMFCSSGGVINHCTISGNAANNSGGGVYSYNGGAFRNSIIYSNTAVSTGNNYYNTGAGMSYNHCCAIPAFDAGLGTNNLAENPLLVDHSAGDVRLQAGSPCIDAGNNTYVVGEFDFDGNVRIQHGTVDMGAFEFGHTFPANKPQWWQDYHVLNPTAATNDYAIANAGQLKYVASKAREAMDDLLPGGAGTNVHTLVDGFQSSNNYAVINLGQLKYVAQPFYNRLTPDHTNLWPFGMTVGPYPWSESTHTPQDYDIANLGQLKYIFSFDFSQ